MILTDSYIRRKEWEAELVAAKISRALSGGAHNAVITPVSSRAAKQVTADQLFKVAGAKLPN